MSVGAELDLAAHAVQRMGEKVVQPLDASDQWRQGSGDLRIGHVGDVSLPVDRQIVNLRMNGTFDLRSRPSKPD